MDDNILIVDDNTDNLRMLARMLRGYHFYVTPASSGAIALKAAQEEQPDLVLLDINMPKMNGYEVCEAFKNDDRLQDVPIIFVSADDEPLDKLRAFDVGGVDYVTKPVDEQEMVARIETHLTIRRLQRELQTANESLEEKVLIRTEQLDVADQSLENKNIALRQVIASVQDEKKGVETSIRRNVEMLIYPSLNRLQCGATAGQNEVIDQIMYDLEKITSPFIDKIADTLSGLTPTELRICSKIRQGLGIKEIAGLETISPETVRTHRRNIRRKLGISNRKVNLATYLNSTFKENDLNET